MKRIIHLIFLLVLLILISPLMLTGCTTQETGHKEVLKQVYTKTIKSSAYGHELTCSGHVVPIQTVPISFKIPGVVSGVLVNEGDYVKKGQVIAKMDPGDYLIKVKAAQAELEAGRLQIATEIPATINQAKAQYDLTKVAYARVKTLYEHESVPQSQMDEVTAKLAVDENTYTLAVAAKDVAEKKLQMAEAALDLANANIRDTTIYSPVDGVVLKKMVASGEVTGAGYPVVAIGQVDPVWVQIGVPDEYINALHIKQKANVYIYGLDQSMEGVVDEITSLADPKTRTFPVKILINNPQGQLKPGMISKVGINLSTAEKILIPLSSVIHLAGGSVVFIYTGDTQTVSKRMIETGEIWKDQIEVLQGLEAGEKIIVEGQFVIRDGDQVAAKEMKQ